MSSARLTSRRREVDVNVKDDDIIVDIDRASPLSSPPTTFQIKGDWKSDFGLTPNSAPVLSLLITCPPPSAVAFYSAASPSIDPQISRRPRCGEAALLRFLLQLFPAFFFRSFVLAPPPSVKWAEMSPPNPSLSTDTLTRTSLRFRVSSGGPLLTEPGLPCQRRITRPSVHLIALGN